MTDIKNLTRYALALLVGSTLAVQVSAHGGEDHGDEQKPQLHRHRSLQSTPKAR